MKGKLGSSEKLENVAQKRRENRELRCKEIEEIQKLLEGETKLLEEKDKMRSTVHEVLSNPPTKKFEILQRSLGTFWATEKQCFVRELFWKAEKNSWKHYSKTQKSCSW